MSADEFKQIGCKIFPSTLSLQLSCGFEPLLNPDFDQCLHYAKKMQVPFVSFATNGMLLNETVCKRIIDEKLDELIVSVDGGCASTFESVRVGTSFDTLVRNLKFLQTLKNNRNKTKPVLRINYTVMDHNVAEILMLIPAFAQMGMKSLQLRPAKAYPDLKRPSIPQLLTEDGACMYNRNILEIRRSCRRYRIRLIALERLGADALLQTHQSYGRSSPASSKNVKDWRNPCILPWIYLYIDAHGDLTPCVSGPHAIGNLFNNTYGDICRSDPMIDFRRLTCGANSYCNNCELLDDIIA